MRKKYSSNISQSFKTVWAWRAASALPRNIFLKHWSFVCPTRLELATHRLKVCCATNCATGTLNSNQWHNLSPILRFLHMFLSLHHCFYLFVLFFQKIQETVSIFKCSNQLSYRAMLFCSCSTGRTRTCDPFLGMDL